MRWRAVLLSNGERHVIPLMDHRPHHEDRACWCAPYDDDGVIVHNSIDRRETYEKGRKLS